MLAGWAAGAGAVSLRVSRVETVVKPSKPELKLVTGLKPGDTLDSVPLSRARERVTGELADEGYFSPVVEADTTVRGDSVDVRFQIETGKPAYIGGWHILQDSGVPADKLSRLLPGRGARFSRAAVDRAASSMLSVCENSGYPFAAVTPLALSPESGFVFPALEVAAGPRVEVDFIEFAGKPGTKTGLLQTVAGFSRGPYSSAATAEWRQRLEQSGLVEVDSEAIVSTGTEDGGRKTEDGYGVRFWVTSRRVNAASGVAGYSPADRRLTGLAQLSFHNLFDSGRKLEASWQSAYARTSYSLSYTEPWVLGTAIDMTASAQQQTIDTTSSRTNLALSADARAATWTTVSFQTGFDRFTDVPSRASADVVWAGTGVVLDSRDFPPNPRSGIRASALTKVGNRTTDSAGTAVVTHVELGLNGVLPVGRSFAWSNSLGLRTVYSAATLTASELYTIGGPGTVRGYSEDEYTSTRLGWFSSEFRYNLDRMSSVFPFFDVGSYQDSLGWHVEPGYGAGTRVATQAGVFGLSYGVAFRDSPLHGKVHLSYDVTF
ncbi:MAG TPA: BamA/TamA family outer membrane protein [bacterium]|nr:BamA/TamA family outer membrane protein [bacterium]